MDFILSLAHFCEIHGPTSILCTQLNPVDCATCFPASSPPSEDVSSNSSYESSNKGGFQEAATAMGQKIGTLNAPTLSSPFDSPPMSPSIGSHNPYFPDHRPLVPQPTHSTRSSVSMFSTGSESDTESCDNCMFLVPKAMSEKLPDGAPGSPIKDGKGQHGSPVLRTTQAMIARGAPPTTGSCDDRHYEQRDRSAWRQRDVSTPNDDEEATNPLVTASSTSSSDSTGSTPYTLPPTTHTHKLTYVTTKQPLSQQSYSFLRRACIRTLSNETLPKGSPSGPLFFGDPHAGYTIAYVFRVPDPRARGRRRMYALLALGGKDSWRVSRVYVMLTRVFESIANSIIAMADRVIERELSPSPTDGVLSMTILSSSLPAADPANPVKTQDRKVQSATTSPIMKNARRFDNTSSFLTGKRVDPDGFPRVSGEVMKAKGLAEIVGKEGIFVELHARFCVILRSLVAEPGI